MNVSRIFYIGIALAVGVYALSKWSEPATPQLEGPRCPAIQDVSHRPLGDHSFNGKAERIHTAEFDDVYLSDREDKFKVGAREQWGGSLVFFGESGGAPGANSTNTLDNSALGRGLSLIFHDDHRKKWSPHQAGNRCGIGSGVEGSVLSPDVVMTVAPLLENPAWKHGDFETACADPKLNHAQSNLRLHQSLRFVQSRVLEVEYLVTNLGLEDIVAKENEPNEIPNLFASNGKQGGNNLNILKNARGEVMSGEKRSPAASVAAIAEPRGWASFQNANSDYGIGVYWENRGNRLRVLENNGLSAGFPFTIPARESVRTRFYLLLGGYSTIKALARELDRSLPPFGRIDRNQINEDARSVKLSGWALDNKYVTALELWVDGKKVSDIKLDVQRDDVCANYPGYAMCDKNHFQVGFETDYPRPNGTGCDRPVEVRAQDSDGNWRVIARKSITPVVY